MVSAVGGTAAKLKTVLADAGGGGFSFPEPYKFIARVPREFNPSDVEIKVTYDDGAAQRIIQSTQIKQIVSNNGGYVDSDPEAAAAAGIHDLNTLDITETFEDMFEKAKAELDEQLPENFDFPEILNAQPVMDLVKALGDQRKADAEAEQATDGDDPQAVIGAMSAQANAGEATQDEGPISHRALH